jgi:hypothetical protein
LFWWCGIFSYAFKQPNEERSKSYYILIILTKSIDIIASIKCWYWDTVKTFWIILILVRYRQFHLSKHLTFLLTQRGTFEDLLHTYNTLFNIQCNKLCWNTITHSIKFSNLMVRVFDHLFLSCNYMHSNKITHKLYFDLDCARNMTKSLSAVTGGLQSYRDKVYWHNSFNQMLILRYCKDILDHFNSRDDFNSSSYFFVRAWQNRIN